MADSKNKEDGASLHKSQLVSTEATAAVGLNAISRLLEFGVVTLFLDKQGYVLLADPGEITLDALPEQMAIKELVDRGYDDARLEEYLKGRDARMGRG